MADQKSNQQTQGSGAISLKDNKAQIVSIVTSEKFKQQLLASLAKHRLDPEFVIRCAVGMVNSSEKLQQCTPVSIAASVLALAQAGLAPEQWKGQAYLIPRNMKIKRGNVERYEMTCTALIGYRGFVTLAYRVPKVAAAGAFPVYEGDIFDLELSSGQAPVHKPWMRPEAGREKRGDILGAYAFVKLKDGEYLVEWMTKEDIEDIKGRSQSPDKGPWKTDYTEMARKTPFRRLFKWVPDAELQGIAAMDEAREFGIVETILDSETGEIISIVRDDEEEQKKDPVAQPQRIAQGEKKETVPTTMPAEEKKPEPVGIKSAQPDQSAQQQQAAQPEQSAQEPSTAQAEESKSGTEAPPALENPFDKEAAEEKPVRELTYDASASQDEPDRYHKTDNPNGKHISKQQHARLMGISNSANKARPGAVPTLEELRAHVVKLGYKDERFVPYNREIYDAICEWANTDKKK